MNNRREHLSNREFTFHTAFNLAVSNWHYPDLCGFI